MGRIVSARFDDFRTAPVSYPSAERVITYTTRRVRPEGFRKTLRVYA